MEALKDVTSLFRVDRIFDVAFTPGWVVAAAGDQGLALCHPEGEAYQHLTASLSLDGPILLYAGRVIFDRHWGVPNNEGKGLVFSPMAGSEDFPLKEIPLPHFSFATQQALYCLKGEGDLIRLDMKGGKTEIPESPYGRYAKDDHCVSGIGQARKGAIALSRYPGRAENLVDSLPDHPSRPQARVAVLKDKDVGIRLSGPTISSRWAYLICHDKECLLTLHLRNPEVMEKSPIPPAVAREERVILAADGSGRVAAGSALGLHLLAGAGSPAHYPFPSDGAYHPSRLILNEGFALLNTREGRLFHTPY
jgi:hypothetical protein